VALAVAVAIIGVAVALTGGFTGGLGHATALHANVDMSSAAASRTTAVPAMNLCLGLPSVLASFLISVSGFFISNISPSFSCCADLLTAMASSIRCRMLWHIEHHVAIRSSVFPRPALFIWLKTPIYLRYGGFGVGPPVRKPYPDPRQLLG